MLELVTVDFVISQVIVFYIDLLIIFVVQATFKTIMAMNHFPECHRVGDARLVQPLGVVTIFHPIDDQHFSQFGGNHPFMAFGLGPCFLIDFVVLRDDVGHGIDGL